MHLKPAALCGPDRQFGLSVVSTRLSVPVEFVRSIGSAATSAPGLNGHARLVPFTHVPVPAPVQHPAGVPAPVQYSFGFPDGTPLKLGSGCRPFTSHVSPARTPVSQVPLATLSFAIISPMQLLQGFPTSAVRNTDDVSVRLEAVDPVSRSAVPVNVAAI